MSATDVGPQRPDRHLLLYESRVEGHHLSWLRMITEDLLAAEVFLSLAVRQDDASRRALEAALGDLLSRVRLWGITGEANEPSAGRQLRRAAELMAAAQAEAVFFCCLDEVASACLRRAALGWFPPPTLRGRFGGIFILPRFLAPERRTLNQRLKAAGFRRLIRRGWLRQVLFLDESLCETALTGSPGGPFFALPDPPTQTFGTPRATARAELGLPPDRRVFLFYGGPYRRKGLHLAVRAFRELPPELPAMLLCVGQQPADPEVAENLRCLENEGRARVFNYYVSVREEHLSFCASDVVLLPYLQHFGSSGVLAQATAAGKPVIASDEGLVGRRVRDYRLGWRFPSGDTAALREALRSAAVLTEAELGERARPVQDYALKFSRAGFRSAILASLGLGSVSATEGSPAA